MKRQRRSVNTIPLRRSFGTFQHQRQMSRSLVVQNVINQNKQWTHHNTALRHQPQPNEKCWSVSHALLEQTLYGMSPSLKQTHLIEQ